MWALNHFTYFGLCADSGAFAVRQPRFEGHSECRGILQPSLREVRYQTCFTQGACLFVANWAVEAEGRTAPRGTGV